MLAQLFVYPTILSAVSIETMEKISKLQKIYQQNELVKAENLALEILSELESETDKDFKHITGVLNKLNGIYKKTNQMDKAFKYIKEAYDISKKETGIPEYATILYTINLATTCNHMHKTDDAIKYYEESINKLTKLLQSKKTEDRDFAQFALPRCTDELLVIYHKNRQHKKVEKLQADIDKYYLNIRNN